MGVFLQFCKRLSTNWFYKCFPGITPGQTSMQIFYQHNSAAVISQHTYDEKNMDCIIIIILRMFSEAKFANILVKTNVFNIRFW